MVAQLDELTVLVTDLVDLARGDEPAEVTQDVRLDLLVRDAVERARRRAPGKHLVTDLHPTLVVGVSAGSTVPSPTCSTTLRSGASRAARSRSRCAAAR